MSPALQTSFKI